MVSRGRAGGVLEGLEIAQQPGGYPHLARSADFQEAARCLVAGRLQGRVSFERVDEVSQRLARLAGFSQCHGELEAGLFFEGFQLEPSPERRDGALVFASSKLDQAAVVNRPGVIRVPAEQDLQVGQCRLVVTGAKSDGNCGLAQLGAVVELQRARDRFGGEGVGLLVRVPMMRVRVPPIRPLRG